MGARWTVHRPLPVRTSSKRRTRRLQRGEGRSWAMLTLAAVWAVVFGWLLLRIVSDVVVSYTR